MNNQADHRNCARPGRQRQLRAALFCICLGALIHAQPWTVAAQETAEAAEETGLTVADLERLANLPPAARQKMLELLEAAGISTKASNATLEAASGNLEVSDEGEFEIGEIEEDENSETEAAEVAPVEEKPETMEEQVAALPSVDDLVVVEEDVLIFDEVEETPTPAPEVADATQEAPTPPAEEQVAALDPSAAVQPTLPSAPAAPAAPVLESPATAGTDTPEPPRQDQVAALQPEQETPTPPALAVPEAPAVADTPAISTKTDPQEGTVEMAALPDTGETPAPETPAVDLPEDLARAVQAELKRVGCYYSSVDGIWGKGSRAAVSRFYINKGKAPDSLEPTAAMYLDVKTEEGQVCKRVVAKKKPPSKTTTTKKAAPAPAKKKPAFGMGTGVFR